MTTTIRPTRAKTTATKRVPMDSLRKTALVAGVLYVITFVSIPTLVLYGPVLGDPNYIVGSGPDTAVSSARILEVIVALAGIGTAVALYPVVKRQNEGVALGFVASRTPGSRRHLRRRRQPALAGDSAAGRSRSADALVTGQALVAQYDWTFLLGPGLMPALNALLLGSLLYRSRLVPRVLPLMGLIGAPLLLASDIAVLFGLCDRISAAVRTRSPSRSRCGSSRSASI